MHNLIYLSGPITGLTYDDGNDWRIKAIDMLEYTHSSRLRTNIKCLNPMRAHQFLRANGVIGDREGQDRSDGFLVSDEFIGTRDAWDTMRSTAMLVNVLDAKRISVGTVLEIGMAHAARVPIFYVSEPTGNLHEHGMIRNYITMRFDNLENACKALLAMYGE